jgi:hypothetical protein
MSQGKRKRRKGNANFTSIRLSRDTIEIIRKIVKYVDYMKEVSGEERKSEMRKFATVETVISGMIALWQEKHGNIDDLMPINKLRGDGSVTTTT